MGSYVYIGPYLTVKNKEISTDYTAATCPTKKCANYGRKLGGKFCRDCGAELVQKINKDKRVMGLMEILENEENYKLVDELSGFSSDSKDYQNFFSNRAKSPGWYFNAEYEKEIPLYEAGKYNKESGLTINDPEKDVTALEKAMKKVIDYLEKNEFQYEFKWGILIGED